jgi:carbon-monoxide dehydrogenase small subunit
MTPKTISLTVNGGAVTAAVEPRAHLADFLREQRMLTGTHLGCEHGVCGACTLEIDGQIARSCIALAVACDGAEVRTIEGFDDDPLMARLRRAFSEKHGLQCGYCTPGMLITARDIVTRLPGADEARVREELSGNLCRCTGYMGIVEAILSVLDERRGGEDGVDEPARPAPVAAPISVPGAAEEAVAKPTAGSEDGLTTLHQSFTVDHPRAAVWDFFGEVDRVAACMPGASVSAPASGGHVTGQIDIKLGPIGATFAGEADIERDAAAYRGAIRGGGRDKLSATRARGEVRYSLVEADGGRATRVDLALAYALAGPLAQFSRAALVEDLVQRLTAAFATNLEARLAGAPAAPAPAKLDAGSLLLSVAWARIKALIAGLFGRR